VAGHGDGGQIVRAETLLRALYRLIDDVSCAQVVVRDQAYALNALHLLRDAVQDLEGVRSLVDELERRRGQLQTLQLSEMIFHGPNHNAYHDVARQLRAVIGSGLAQSKRVLNQTADVIDAFIDHGTGLRCRSFGSQLQSLSRVDRNKSWGDRTSALLALLAERGPQLEKYNDFRDKFIEHAHPLRETRQPRPASGHSTLGFHGPADSQSPPIDRVLDSGPGWVRMEAISSSGRTYRVVRAHAILIGDASGPYRIELDPTMTGHFRSTDPHHHQYLEDPEDDLEDGVIDQGLSFVSSSDLSEVQESVIRYVRDLIQACSVR
jgi:hypothetical protein